MPKKKSEEKSGSDKNEQSSSSNEQKLLLRNERVWAIFCHLGAFVGFFVPFGNILAPLIIWLLKREDFTAIDQHGKESLNFQISMTIYMVIAVLLSFLLIGIPILIALIILNLVLVIKAAIEASSNRSYHYPLSIKVIK